MSEKEVKPVVESEEDKELKRLEIESRKLELAIKQQQFELQKQQAEALALEQEERRYHIQDLKHSLAERAHREKQLRESREASGVAIAQMEANDRLRQKICTHRKGGVVTPRDMRVLHTGGNKDQYSIIRHQMINGDIWVLCLRCAKTWKPPVKLNFYFDEKGKSVAPQDGVFNAEAFAKAQEDYRWACQVNTNNTMSTSVQCRFSRVDETGREIDAADKYRENIASTTLR